METLKDVTSLPPEDCAAKFSLARIDRLELAIGALVLVVAAVVAVLIWPLLGR